MPNLLRPKQVAKKRGSSITTLYTDIREGRFPKGVKINSRMTVWDESEVDAHIENQLKQAKAEQLEKKLEPKAFRCCLRDNVAQIEMHAIQDIENFNDDLACPLKIEEPNNSEENNVDLIRIITFCGGIYGDVFLTREKARKFGQYLIDFSSQKLSHSPMHTQ